MKTLNSSVCGGDGDAWPPGFRFHPTDEELVLYYLKRRICRLRLKLDIIAETDVYKWDPEELPEQSKLKTGDRQWFFFSPRDRKYPNGARSNRATRHGYWKTTGKDRAVRCNSRSVGVKKTLVFYKGRAPSGERTDWVMHEYTMDEEELKKCQSAQDYFALYKVFKKSGPGPKNGEEYGAPFKEEDWADDECSNGDHNLQENSVMQVNDVASTSMAPVREDETGNISANGQVKSALRDLEEFVNRITDEPSLAQLLAVVDPLVDPSFRDANSLGQSIVTHPNSQQYDLQSSFDLTRSAIPNVQIHETLEVTSAVNVCEQGPHATEDDFIEDLIEMDDLFEMDDLVGPVAAVQDIENLQFSEFDGLGDVEKLSEVDDLYLDAAMFLHDINQGPQSYFNNLEDGMVNPLDFQFESCSNDANHSIITPAASNHGTVPEPASGVVCAAGNSGNLPTSTNQNESGKEDDGTVTWFSSALWSFVELIPTTPAFTSESALVNRAFERMSSFGRVRMDAGNTNVAAGNSTATVIRSGKYNCNFLCFSVLRVVCAILWMIGSVNCLWKIHFLFNSIYSFYNFFVCCWVYGQSLF
ncbi:NAC domain-containing protein 17-like isoform X1 [Cornus florida]|uniref:NAC domain-containing protein 17-like isoform X1 n=1 Tax=Cornus florida TaxID=4283 RepID=UPI0028A04834|nr:NAC domain-containing protein 17-like isoform X1 [Cornus florida]